jgi:hypothetical protein
MCYIKDNYPKDKFEAAFEELWITMWKEQMNLEKPEIMKEALLRHFSAGQIKEIMESANSPKYKQTLLDNTKTALEAGAFGCPWFVVTNSKGVTEPFFGSDRYVLDRNNSQTTWMLTLLKVPLYVAVPGDPMAGSSHIRQVQDVNRVIIINHHP